jgi:hypothetical protein
MFPRLRQQLLAQVDVLVELSTLGGYGVDERGAPMTLDGRCGADSMEPEPARPLPRTRDRCPRAGTGARDCATGRGRAAPARP